MSDQQIWALNRGGHSPRKVYAAYHAAMQHEGQPTVILAKTIKGYGMGRRRRGPEDHPPAEEDERGRAAGLPRPLQRAAERRRRARRPRSTSRRADSPGDGLPARAPRGARRQPARARADRPGDRRAAPVGVRRHPEGVRRSHDLDDDGLRAGAEHVLRDKTIGPRVVPIVADESRTFGMEGMFRQLGIFSQVGQLYSPEDSDQLMFYREDRKGQILQEGITEAGALSSWIAAGTSYANHGVAMIPFFIFYSMFGFQRVGDLIWAAGRQPGARVPARRHVRAHDAERRGPPARGRPQPPHGRHGPQLPLIRPDLRLRGRGDPAGRPAPHARGPARRLLLPHPAQRELRAPGDARGRREGHPARHAPDPRGGGAQEGPAGAAAWARARSCAR